MAAYAGRRRFGPSPGAVIAVALCEALLLYGAVSTFRMGGVTATSGILAAMALLGAGGIAESLVRHIVLEDDAMFVVDLWSRRRYPRSEIVRIAEAKGCPVMLVLTGGRSRALPPVAPPPGNSIRAWLRATG